MASSHNEQSNSLKSNNRKVLMSTSIKRRIKYSFSLLFIVLYWFTLSSRKWVIDLVVTDNSTSIKKVFISVEILSVYAPVF